MKSFTVRMCGRPIHVRFDANLMEEGNWGSWVPGLRLIKLYPSSVPVEVADAFIHELLHAAENILGLQLGEPVVKALGAALAEPLMSPAARHILAGLPVGPKKPPRP